MSYVARSTDKDIGDFIADARTHKNILLVEGARQVGKSFMVAHALRASSKRSFSLNLEKETRLRSLIDECPEFRDFEQLLRDRVGFDGGADAIRPIGVEAALELQFEEAVARVLGDFHGRVSV